MTTNQSAVTPTGIAVALAVVVALGFLFFGPALFTPLESGTEPVATSTAALSANSGTLMVTDTKEGTGTEATLGATVTVNYVGRFENGQVFDASANHGQPFTFTLGVDPVIKGWEQGLQGMKAGGIRTLVIPPELGYGEAGVQGTIPPNATLIFEVELLSVEPAE